MGFLDFLNIFNFMNYDIAIDLGTANTLIYVKGEGIVINEPSVVAIEKNTRKIIAVGKSAKEMIGRTPKDKEAIRPLKDGVIADFTLTTHMLDYFIKQVYKNRFIHPRVLVSVPSGITEVEKKAVIETIENAGARESFLISEPIAAAIGVDIPIEKSSGNMIIDIGGGTTEIAVLSLSGIVAAESLKIAGDEMNQAIINYLKNNYRVVIGENTAEEIKIKAGSAVELDEEITIEIKGKSTTSPSPFHFTASSKQIREALQEPINKIVEAVKRTLEKVPPELSSDIYSKGIIMTGGGSLLKGLDKKISEEINLSVRVSDEPLLCVVKGSAKVLENIDKYSNLLLPLN